jgi:hypothetical protein
MPKLTLRDLFAVVTIAAVLVAWWVDHRRLTMEAILQSEENAILALRATGARIGVDAQGHAISLAWEIPTRGAFTDDDLAHVSSLEYLKEVWLEQTDVTDAGLRHLKHLRQLETLALICKSERGTPANITDVGIERLSGLTNLQVLRLDNADVTDAGLAHLRKLTKLRDLDLFGTEISDAGLVHLQGLKNLEYLDISETRWEKRSRAITVEAATALGKHLPRCDVIY